MCLFFLGGPTNNTHVSLGSYTIYIYILPLVIYRDFFLAPCRNLKYFEGEIAKVAFLPGKVKRFETRAPLPPPWGPTIDSWKTYLELS